MKFSQREIRDLLKAWLAISVAFAIVLVVRDSGINFFPTDSSVFLFISTFVLASITVGTGFLVHESAHKYMAQKYGHFAEFFSSDKMLLLALLMSPLGFIIAIPGAVMIGGRVTRRQNGKISIAGPLVNFIIAAIFIGITFITQNVYIIAIAVYGAMINTWLGLFNLIPLGPFDGRKIWAWNKLNYLLVAVFGIFLFALMI